MRFRHAFRISIDSFSTVFKLLLYRFITGVIFGSIAYVILTLGFAAITHSAETARIIELIRLFLHALTSGDSASLRTFQADFHAAITAFVNLIAYNSASIIWCFVGLCFIYLIARFVNGLSTVAAANIVEDRMSLYAHTSFAQAYFRSLGKAVIYQLIYVPLSFLYDVFTLVLCWFFFFFVPSLLSWGFLGVLISVSLTLMAIVVLQALKMTLISGWLPAVISDGKSVPAALRGSLRAGKGFAVRFAVFTVSLFLIFAANAAAAVFTVGSALVLTVPFSFLLLLCIQFVNYYCEQDKRYFISHDRVEAPNHDFEA